MGRKNFPPVESQEFRRPERRHLAASQASGFDLPETGVSWQSKARVYWPNTKPAHNYISPERTLQMETGIRKKVGGLGERRNRISVAVPGDKPYASADLSPGFFKQQGGIIPGSCIQDMRRRKHHQQAIEYRPKPTYAEKKLAEAEHAMVTEVLELNNWDRRRMPVEPHLESSDGGSPGDESP